MRKQPIPSTCEIHFGGQGAFQCWVRQQLTCWRPFDTNASPFPTQRAGLWNAYRYVERGTHACKASRLGPIERRWTQDGKLGITIQDRPPESGRRTHLLYFTYSHCILSRVWKLATSLLIFTILWTSISGFYVKTARDVVTVLLIFAKYLSLYLHIFTCTYGGTHIQAHMYNQHKRGIAATRHRSLIERGGRKALLETLRTQKKKNRKKCQKKTDIHESQEKIRAHRASSKATRLFLTK